MGGARRFPAAAEHQVRVIQSALRIGFTLGELAEILSERRRGGAPCRKVYALACAKLQTLEARLRDLQTLRDALEATLGGWKARLEGTAEGARAGLLDALTEELSVAPRPSPFARRSATP
jgi:DNA-binding transcriptional MerR regulator